MHLINKIYKVFQILIVLLCAMGCKEADPNPELKDRIYLDLVDQYESNKAGLEEKITYIKEQQDALEKTKIHSVERVAIRRDIKKNQNLLYKLEKLTKYYKIRAERRRVISRRQYKAAFHSNQPWPPADDGFEAYQLNKKLVNVNKNWQARVPKLFSGNPNYIPPQKQ